MDDRLTEKRQRNDDDAPVELVQDESPAPVKELSAAAKDALEKAKKIAAYSKLVKHQLAKLTLPDAPAPKAPERRVEPRMSLKPIVHSTLKVNINRDREERLKHVFVTHRPDRSLNDPSSNKWFDMSIGGIKPKKKGLRFVDQGFYQKKEELLAKRFQDHRKMRHSSMPSEPEEVSIKIDESSIAGLGRTTMSNKKYRDPVPEVEWWDLVFLRKRDPKETVPDNWPSDSQYLINLMKVNHLVEHPVPVPTIEPGPTAYPNVFLTPKEKKKFRRLKRQEREKEKQDKIRIGLIPPPPSKIKLSNLMKVLADENIQDPSKTERDIREQIRKRAADHMARNLARKLTPEQKARRMSQKWQSESKEVNVAVFMLKDLSDRRHLFKVDVNAQQYHFTGVCIICPNCKPLVVIEGGATSVRRYTKLLMKRVEWVSVDHEEEDEEGEVDKNRGFCQLVWHGYVKERTFKSWKLHNVKSEGEARKLLADRKAEHYWDLLKKYRDPTLDEVTLPDLDL